MPAVAPWAAVAAAVAALAVAAAGDLQAAAGPAGGECGPACAGGDPPAAAAAPPQPPPPPTAPLPLPHAAAQGARMSIVVTLAGDFLVMREGGVHLRGDMVAHDYDPREGHMFQEIRREPGGPVISKTKIFVKTGVDGTWVAQVGSVLSPEDYPPGDYSIRIVTESGLGSKRAPFAVSDRPGPEGTVAPSGRPGAAVLPDAPSEIAEILPDAPSEIAEILPDAPSEIAKALQPDAPGNPPGPPHAGRPAPSAASPMDPPPDGEQAPAAEQPALAFLLGIGHSLLAHAADLLDYLSALFTANRLVLLVLSVVISFFVMMAIRTAWRRWRRRRRRR